VRSLRVYSRPGCHLCEALIDDLQAMVRGRLALEVVDVDADSGWREAFGTRIPVVEFDGKTVCQYALDRDAVRAIMDAEPGS